MSSASSSRSGRSSPWSGHNQRDGPRSEPEDLVCNFRISTRDRTNDRATEAGTPQHDGGDLIEDVYDPQPDNATQV
jgi:hypothetical protein